METASFATSDGVDIAFRSWRPDAAGPTVILQHGFMSNAEINWEVTGVAAALLEAGHPVVALDARGHGHSGKPVDPDAYSLSRMAQDVVELADHLALEDFHLVGYSMGALVSGMVAAEDSRVCRLVLGGIGGAAADPASHEALDLIAVAEALDADDPAALSDPVGASFRAFADAVGADLAPLAAAARGHAGDVVPFERIPVPTLVLAGADDPIALHPAALVARIDHATLEVVPGDHLKAVSHPDFRFAIVRFLEAPPT